MASYNKIIIMGNLVRDPELSYLPSQTAAVKFSLATTHKYRGADGQDREDTCFIDCKMFGKRAEVIHKYFSKGKPILVEGRLKLEQWDAPDGTKRSKHCIMVESFQFIGGSESNTQRQPNNERQSATTNEDYTQPPVDDDIPF